MAAAFSGSSRFCFVVFSAIFFIHWSDVFSEVSARGDAILLVAGLRYTYVSCSFVSGGICFIQARCRVRLHARRPVSLAII